MVGQKELNTKQYCAYVPVDLGTGEHLVVFLASFGIDIRNDSLKQFYGVKKGVKF